MNQTKNIRYRPEVNQRQFEPKRIAVYARVSREGEWKHHSIEAQKENLKREIEKHPNWCFVGFYVDEGITGTKLDRPEFNRLMHDARSGNLDIILVKTVSRLGRNTAAVQRVLQELKSLDVIVIFDNEHISTADPDAALYLHFLGIQAEAEAKQTSDYQKWSIRNRFAAGIPTHARPYGYYMRDRKYYVVPEEAEVVKRIFDMYLSGMGRERICKVLNREGIPSQKGTGWKEITIRNMLRNERYTGDLLLQKWYVSDYITKISKRNFGELPQFLIEDAHEPIIDKETFQAVQKEIARRAEHYGGYNKTDKKPPRLFSKLIRCGHCKKNMNYKCYKSNGYVRELWVCPDHSRLGAEMCPVKSIREDILTQITYEILLHRNLIKDDTTLTNELLKLHIKRIIARDNQILEYHLRSGEVVTTHWENVSRSKSWTPEMKQKAREKVEENASKQTQRLFTETRKEEKHGA